MSLGGPQGSTSLAATDHDLVTAVVRFCRLLRQWGVRMPAGSSQVALQVLREIDITRRRDFRSALKVALVKRPEDFSLFIYLFNAYWRRRPEQGETSGSSDVPNRPVDAKRLGRDIPEEDEEDSEDGSFQPMGSSLGLAEGPPEDDDPHGARAARVGKGSGKGEGGSSPLEQAEFERLARALSSELATRPSRRRVSDKSGRYPDPRGMLRFSLRHGGLPIEFRWKSRRVTRTRLLLFCDVSRSMDEHARLFLDFAAAVLRRVWRVEVFLFASELVRVTDLWLDRNWSELKDLVPDCGGGTQIGACLGQFFHEYDRCLVGTNTISMILSDGLDAGEPELIDSEMDRLHRQSKGVIWLNPLLHLEGYEPKARGMKAALGHVDLFVPAHDLGSLWDLLASIRESFGGRALAEHLEYAKETSLGFRA